MKQKLIIIGLIILIGCKGDGNFNKNETAKFNFESLEKYFELIEELKLRRVIDSTKWKEFLELEGNRLYVDENNISKEFTENLKLMLEQVYTSPDSLNENKSEDIVYSSRVRYKKEEHDFIEHMNWLKNNQEELNDSIVSRTKQFLPNRQKLRDTFPQVYYHALDFDASANTKGIFISIMSAYDNNKKRLGNFEAHELHHLYRRSILEDKKIQEKDKGIIWAIEAALDEGIADMVDKDVMLSKESDWWLKEYVVKHYEENGKKALLELNNYILALLELNNYILDEIENNHHSENEYREIYYGSVGHLPGYYMAKSIKEDGRLDELIEISDNPFKFCMLYNESAKNSKGELPIFNEEAINYIQQLMDKYQK